MEKIAFSISLGIMAFNEEANIGNLLHSIKKQRIGNGTIKEIIIVASGCTDGTVDAVRQIQADDDRIKLLIQDKREGKASAINFFLSKASADVFILESGDTIPKDGALENLISPFADKDVGMTGARPIPVNPKSSFMGFTVHFLWHLHHTISLEHPKMGELVAFRGFVKKIPMDTSVDEASIEAMIKRAGFQIRYVPEAIVFNKGPDNIRDYIRQRRRVAAGHLHLLRRDRYRVSTTSTWTILQAIGKQKRRTIKESLWTLSAIGLEVLGRLLGYYDYIIRKKNHVIWDIASSTKRVM